MRKSNARKLSLIDWETQPDLPFRILLLPQFSKGGTYFFDKNGWLLKSHKVAALFCRVPVDEIGIGLFNPALWSAVCLLREDGCRDRQAELAS